MLKKTVIGCCKNFWVCIFLIGNPVFYSHALVNAEGHFEDESYYTFYIVQHHWHTGIILETATIPDSLWPNAYHFKNHNFIDIGWGEEFFYQEPQTNLFHALRAVLWPTPSAIRVHAFTTVPTQYYGGYANLFQLKATPQQYYRLVKFIAESFKEDDNGELLPSYSRNFYKANRSYHLFRTCNTWVCLGLKSSGYPVRYRGVITRRQLFRQIKRIENSSVN